MAHGPVCANMSVQAYVRLPPRAMDYGYFACPFERSLGTLPALAVFASSARNAAPLRPLGRWNWSRTSTHACGSSRASRLATVAQPGRAARRVRASHTCAEQACPFRSFRVGQLQPVVSAQQSQDPRKGGSRDVSVSWGGGRCGRRARRPPRGVAGCLADSHGPRVPPLRPSWRTSVPTLVSRWHWRRPRDRSQWRVCRGGVGAASSGTGTATPSLTRPTRLPEVSVPRISNPGIHSGAPANLGGRRRGLRAGPWSRSSSAGSVQHGGWSE